MGRDNLKGAAAYDANGEHIGKVEHIYPEDGGPVRYVKVKMGTLLAKHRLVPLDSTERREDGIKFPYSKEAIENAPDLPHDVNPLSGMVAEDLRGYYASTQAMGAHDVSRQDVTSDTTRPEPSTSTVAASAPVTDETDQSTPSNSTLGGPGVRDLGDVVEIPVVEERLVKQPVVTEVIRVRKTPVAGEERMVSTDVRKEDVEVVTDGDVPTEHGDRKD
ncbi:MAG: hypothetical protein NVS4B2_20260 [Chloroflexota bacterium]